jgi:hypothetical protein
MLELNRALLACAPRLLEAAFQADSTALVSDWQVRRFCGLWLQTDELESEEVERIRDLVCFYDQRGQLLPLRDACQGAFLRVSTYESQPWLEASEGGSRNTLDDPVLMMTEDNAVALTPILEALCSETLLPDVSEAMRTLQIARRIEQGLLQAPSVPVEASLKRSITELVGSEVIGEVGFHDGPTTQVRVCEHGEERVREELDILPAVLVALEDPTLMQAAQKDQMWAEQGELAERVRAMTRGLLRSVLTAKADLPEWLRLQIAHALCMGSIKAEVVQGLAERPLFYTTAGALVSWKELEEQAARFGDLWHVPEGERSEPLDPLRFAIVLPPEQRKVFTSALPFLDAELELSMDEIARRNQARAPVSTLTLTEEQGRAAITSMKLEEEELRGVVAPLLPLQAGWRGVVAHQEMKYIGAGLDPCTWPTLAIIDSDEITPNRTWTEPEDDEAWQSVCEVIIKESDHALVKAMPPPEDMLTSHWVGRSVESRDPDYRKRGVSVRGRLWLRETTEPGSIKVRQSSGELLFHPRYTFMREVRFPLPVHGELLCHPAQDLRLDEVVQEVVDIVYPRLLRQAANLKRGSADSKAAHLAIGLATEHATAKSAKKHEFPCFLPEPLGAQELIELTRGTMPVAMIDKGAVTTTPETRVFVRDDSELSRALDRILAGRLFDTATSSVEWIDVELEETAPAAVKPATRSAHVLEGLASDLHSRLAQLSLHTEFDRVSVVPRRRTPFLSFERNQLILAGQGTSLLELQASHSPGDPTYESSLDLLVAHAITLLNQGLTSVTDAAEQRALVSLMRIER